MLKSIFFYVAFTLPLLAYGQNAVNKPNATPVKPVSAIDVLISKGVKFENSNSDSLAQLSKKLYSLSVAQGNKRGQIYAEDFDAFNYWMGANYASAMQAALRALADAERWNVQELIPHIYGVIANLHKENNNYPMLLMPMPKAWKLRVILKIPPPSFRYLALRLCLLTGTTSILKTQKTITV